MKLDMSSIGWVRDFMSLGTPEDTAKILKEIVKEAEIKKSKEKDMHDPEVYECFQESYDRAMQGLKLAIIYLERTKDE